MAPSRSRCARATAAWRWSTKASGLRPRDRQCGSRRERARVGLSILSGGHVSLVGEVLDGLREAGIGDVPVVVAASSRPPTPKR